MTATLEAPRARTTAAPGGLRRLPFLLPAGLAVLAGLDAALISPGSTPH